MAAPRYAFCRLSGAGCLESRCPLADQIAERWMGCREEWLRWDEVEPPTLGELGKARLNVYLRLHDMPVPVEVKLSAVLPSP